MSPTALSQFRALANERGEVQDVKVVHSFTDISLVPCVVDLRTRRRGEYGTEEVVVIRSKCASITVVPP
ncbi:MAG: hypothetical protein ACYC96_10880 [Fimbriimonadaceae bacterium]